MKPTSFTSLAAAALLAPGLCSSAFGQELSARRATESGPLPAVQTEKLPAEPTAAIERDVRFERPIIGQPMVLAKTPPRPDAKRLPAFDRHHVYFTNEADGTQWARG